MEWVLLGVLIAGAVWIFHRWMSRPLRHKGVTVGQIPRYLKGLLSLGAHGTQLVIELEGSRSAVKFAKGIESASVRSLYFAIPRALWSDEQYEAMKQALTWNGFLVVERGIPSRSGEGEVYLCVDHVPSLEAGAKIADLVFHAAGLEQDSPLVAYYIGAVDPAEWKRHMHWYRSQS